MSIACSAATKGYEVVTATYVKRKCLLCPWGDWSIYDVRTMDSCGTHASRAHNLAWSAIANGDHAIRGRTLTLSLADGTPWLRSRTYEIDQGL